MSFVEVLRPCTNRGNKTMTRYPFGDAPLPLVAVDWNLKYSVWINSVRSASATTYYVDYEGGSDSNAGTQNFPFKTIAGALAIISGGDEIVVVGTNLVISDDDLMAMNELERAIPSGLSRTERTIIRAQTPFGVRIRFTTDTRHFYRELIRLDSASFVLIDGFIFEWLNDGGDPQVMAQITAPENILTRCIFKRDQHNIYGGFITAPGNYTLLQDVHGVGGSRYGIQMGTGGSAPGGKGIVRRSVCRVDFTASNQPMAAFSLYGNNSGFNCGEAEFQNCIAIDGPYIDTQTGDYSYTWGGFYHPKNAFEVRHRGCAVVNQGGRAGYWVTDNSNAHSYQLYDCVVLADNALRYGNRHGVHANPNGVADRLTMVDIDGSYLNNGISAANQYSSDTYPDSVFQAPNGADLRFCYGKFGSVWDETGFDQITSDELWNFPYEDIIRSVFREDLPSPSGYTPSSNNSQRGFCADGETLTRYIAGFSTQPVDDVLGGLYT